MSVSAEFGLRAWAGNSAAPWMPTPFYSGARWAPASGTHTSAQMLERGANASLIAGGVCNEALLAVFLSLAQDAVSAVR